MHLWKTTFFSIHTPHSLNYRKPLSAFVCCLLTTRTCLHSPFRDVPSKLQGLQTLFPTHWRACKKFQSIEFLSQILGTATKKHWTNIISYGCWTQFCFLNKLCWTKQGLLSVTCDWCTLYKNRLISTLLYIFICWGIAEPFVHKFDNLKNERTENDAVLKIRM
jgi:hypothetical protein